jgi:hypothetical protein
MLAIRQRVGFATVGGVVALCLLGTNPTAAAPADTTAAQQAGRPTADTENNGQDFTRTLSRDVTISLEIGLPIVRDYPVYNFKTEARLNVKF